MIAILIPAAGASSRMGGIDKLLQPVGGEALLRHVADQARPYGEVFVTLPDRSHARAAVLPRDITAIAVPTWRKGMSESLRAGNAAIPKGADLMILPADMLDITSADIARIIVARTTHPDARIWQGATQDGIPGHPVLFAASLRPGFDRLTGDQGAKPIIMAHAQHRHLVPLPGQNARTDLDTPEDWARWRST